MKAMPIMRVSSSGVGAWRLATAKPSRMKNLIFFARSVRRACSGSSFHTSSGDRLDCSMNVPPSTSPRSGLVWPNTLWSGEITISTSSSSALVSLTGSGLSVM